MIGRDRDLHAGRVTECRVDVPQDPWQRPKFCCSALGRKKEQNYYQDLVFLLENRGLCQLLDSLFGK